MIRTSTLVALAIAAIGWSAGRAADAPGRWRLLGQDRDGTYSYDPGSIRKHGDRIQVLIRTSLFGAPTTMIGRQEVDCAKQTSATLAMRYIDAAGRVLRSVTIPPRHVEHLPLFASPEHETIYRLFCLNGPPLKVYDGPPILIAPR